MPLSSNNSVALTWLVTASKAIRNRVARREQLVRFFIRVLGRFGCLVGPSQRRLVIKHENVGTSSVYQAWVNAKHFTNNKQSTLRYALSWHSMRWRDGCKTRMSVVTAYHGSINLAIYKLRIKYETPR